MTQATVGSSGDGLSQVLSDDVLVVGDVDIVNFIGGTVDQDLENPRQVNVILDGSGGGGGGFITSAEHQTLRQLIHFLDEGPGYGFASGAYKEIVGGVFPTSVTWYTSAAKTHKIIEKIIERSVPPATNLRPTPVVWNVYSSDGSTIVQSLQDDIVYSGAAEASRTRTLT